ncbi:type II toxin-antitoxin system VapB family antitoxin [Methylopila turkensis]|nr:type II toxin-antitoxin system VapB family antitoxin [Methylopila turkensis]
MGRQLNIRSDEAYDIARRVSQIVDRPMSDVVLEALREYGSKFSDQTELTATQKAESNAIRAISRRAASKRLPGVTLDEIMNDMYDEFGLPI